MTSTEVALQEIRDKITVEAIPEEDEEDEFLSFCEKHNIRPLGSGRRGWVGDPINEYIRSYEFMVFLDGKPLAMW